jgi:hypothetical protein
MKKTPLLIVLSLFFFYSCSEEEIIPESPVTAKDLAVSANSSVTGLTRFKVADLAIPSGGLPDGKQFYVGGKLRASTAYNPYGITKVAKSGVNRVRFYVNPSSPSSYLNNTQYSYHHRAEFSRWPWWINHPLGTEEWLGFSYLFPTTSEGFTQNQSPVSIYQNHAGSRAGQTSNPPALQIEIAYPQQINSSDPWRGTPKGGELMLVNNVRKTRYVIPGVRVVAGARINVVMQIIYGLGSKGVWNVWVNGKLVTIPPGNLGSTVWPAKTSSDLVVGGNSKLGLYHHQLRYKSVVLLNASKGHNKMEAFLSDWNDVIRYPKDWDYKNQNAYNAVNTAHYP